MAREIPRAPLGAQPGARYSSRPRRDIRVGLEVHHVSTPSCRRRPSAKARSATHFHRSCRSSKVKQHRTFASHVFALSFTRCISGDLSASTTASDCRIDLGPIGAEAGAPRLPLSNRNLIDARVQAHAQHRHMNQRAENAGPCGTRDVLRIVSNDILDCCRRRLTVGARISKVRFAVTTEKAGNLSRRDQFRSATYAHRSHRSTLSRRFLTCSLSASSSFICRSPIVLARTSSFQLEWIPPHQPDGWPARGPMEPPAKTPRSLPGDAS